MVPGHEAKAIGKEAGKEGHAAKHCFVVKRREKVLIFPDEPSVGLLAVAATCRSNGADLLDHPQ